MPQSGDILSRRRSTDASEYFDLIWKGAASCLLVVQLLLFVKGRRQMGALELDLGRSRQQKLLIALGLLLLVGAACIASILLSLSLNIFATQNLSKVIINAVFALTLGSWLLVNGLSGQQLRECGIWCAGSLLRWEAITGYTRDGSGKVRLSLRRRWPFWRGSVALTVPAESKTELLRRLGERGVYAGEVDIGC